MSIYAISKQPCAGIDVIVKLLNEKMGGVSFTHSMSDTDIPYYIKIGGLGIKTCDDLKSYYRSIYSVLMDKDIHSVALPVILGQLEMEEAVKIVKDETQAYLAADYAEVYLVAENELIRECLLEQLGFMSFDDSFLYEQVNYEENTYKSNMEKAIRVKEVPKLSELIIRYEIRDGRKATQIARASNIDESLYTKLKSGKRDKPNKKTLMKLAMGFHLNLDEATEFLLLGPISLRYWSIFD